MIRENKYETIIQFLNNNHIYPKLKVEVGVKKEKIIGLEVECSPILKEDRMNYLIKLLDGKGYKISWMGNGNDYILIK